MESHIATITHAIQLAVAPVFLLTAIATMINVLSGRLSRIVDRRRTVYARVEGGSRGEDDQEELHNLDRRSALIYHAIFFAVLSALLVCLVVMSAFVGPLAEWDAARVVASLFILAMGALVMALGLFLREIFLAVRAGGHRRR